MFTKPMGLAGIALALVLPATTPVQAQESWPSRRVTIIVPYPAGGYIDAVARFVGEGLRAASNQTVIVVNKPGGNGRIGLGDLVKSEPDGYTLLANNDGGIGIPPAVDPGFTFDYKTGYTPVAQAVEAQYVLAIKADIPARSVQEFVAYAKARPGKLNYGTSGIASTPHVTSAFFAGHFGIEMVHVPYQGAAPVLNDFVAGVTDMYMASLSSIAGHLQNPRVRFLATLAPRRLAQLPDVPTMAEFGVKDMTLVGWLGIFGPPRMSDDVRDGVSAAIEKVVADPANQPRFRSIFADPVTKPGREFGPFYVSEVEKWKACAQRTGFKVGQ